MCLNKNKELTKQLSKVEAITGYKLLQIVKDKDDQYIVVTPWVNFRWEAGKQTIKLGKTYKYSSLDTRGFHVLLNKKDAEKYAKSWGKDHFVCPVTCEHLIVAGHSGGVFGNFESASFRTICTDHKVLRNLSQKCIRQIEKNKMWVCRRQ